MMCLQNAAVRGQLSNFKETVTEAVVNACLRVGKDDRGEDAALPRLFCLYHTYCTVIKLDFAVGPDHKL